MNAALVTGASSGIGREFARMLAEKGYDVVLVARRAQRLAELAAELEGRHRVRCLVVPMDLAQADAPDRIHAAVMQAGWELDVLVNNAGVTPDARFLDRPWEWQAGVVSVMATGPLHLVHVFLPGMLARRHGYVINVSSAGAWYPSTPTQTLYGATKAFLLRATQTLADEYPDSGVSFTTVCPGVTRTEILDLPMSAKAVKGLPPMLIDSPRKVADRGWTVATKGGGTVVVGATGRLLFVLMRIFGERLGGRITAKRLLDAAGEA